MTSKVGGPNGPPKPAMDRRFRSQPRGVRRSNKHPFDTPGSHLSSRGDCDGGVCYQRRAQHSCGGKYMPQLQHNMCVADTKAAVLSIITGGGKWVEITVNADPLYQQLLIRPRSGSGAVCGRARRHARLEWSAAPADRGCDHRGHDPFKRLG
jgi:hypothetical protein